MFAISAWMIACASLAAADGVEVSQENETTPPAKVAPKSEPPKLNQKRADDRDETKKVVPDAAKHVESFGDAAAATARIVTGMKTAEERLARKDTGDETRNVQKQVIDDLQTLIDAASRMQQRQQKQQQQQQQSKQQQNSESQQNEKQQRNQGDSGAGDQNRRKDDKGINPTEAQGESAKKAAATDRNRKLLGEVWGHLPESLRQRLLNDLGEKTLPGYDDLVRRYFEALAEPPKTGSNSSEKKIK